MRHLLLVLLLLSVTPVLADDRHALVIGNDAYENVPVLAKAVADADAVAATLEGQGYRILKATDVGRREMNRAISDFTAVIEPGDTAVVFFAGHGVEIAGENYLLPTDIVAPASADSGFVRSESIALSTLLDRVRATGARMAIMIVDACRDNPFGATTGRSIGRSRGLGRIAAPEGSFVIFSAGAGQLALDRLTTTDEAENSVFTRALLPRLSEPGLELRAMVADLRREVRAMAQTVQHNQTPAYYDELLGDFYFSPANERGFAVEEVPADPPAPTDAMRADFDLARSVGTAAALDAFLAQYADRTDELAYQLALALRGDLSDDEAPQLPPDIRSTAAIIRDTQAALNAVGCSAGVPDGVAGPRTRSAFSAFLSGSGAGLDAASLGTEVALDAVRTAEAPACTAAAPRPGPVPSPTPPPSSLDLTGTWSFQASCALFIQTTGRIRLSRTGPNSFRGPISDSLGQNGRMEVRLSGRSIGGSTYWPTVTHSFSGTLDPDSMGFTVTGTSTCTTRAVRTN